MWTMNIYFYNKRIFHNTSFYQSSVNWPRESGEYFVKILKIEVIIRYVSRKRIVEQVFIIFALDISKKTYIYLYIIIFIR